MASKLAQVHGGIRLLYYDKGTQFGVNFDPFGAMPQFKGLLLHAIVNCSWAWPDLQTYNYKKIYNYTLTS